MEWSKQTVSAILKKSFILWELKLIQDEKNGFINSAEFSGIAKKEKSEWMTTTKFESIIDEIKVYEDNKIEVMWRF